MSETVILSKAAARQRPKPTKDSTIRSSTSVSGAGENLQQGSGAIGETRATVVTTASPLTMKDAVRDNRRLVKDLMALLAIREATKDTIVIDHGGRTTEGVGEEAGMPLKNRPGAPNGGDGRVIALRAVGGGGRPVGTRATAVAAAVASLLHHTATKEFSSLAGEMIAIADDEDDEGDDSNGRKLKRAMGDGGGEACTNSAEDGPMLPPVMLHADAAAADASTSTSTNADEAACSIENVPELAEPTTREQGGRPSSGGDGEPPTQDDVLAGEGLPSGPVPVRAPRAGTPLPQPPSAIPVACFECCMPPGGAIAELTLEQKLDKLLDSVVKIKADMHRRIDRLGRRVEQIHLDVQLNIDSTDRALLRNDLLLIGIPYREREDLQERFRCVCRALEYAEADIPQVDIRRQRSVVTQRRRNNAAQPATGGQGKRATQDAPAPIVVEFMFKTLRDQFYRAYQAKRVLRLSDVGFSSDRRFFVNEVLTRYNQKLMGEAVRRKRAGLLHSVYTVDGVVYVQRSAGEKGTKVTSFASMN